MLVPFLLPILLVAATPVSLFLEGPLERTAAALAAVAAVGVFVRVGKGGHLAKLLRRHSHHGSSGSAAPISFEMLTGSARKRRGGSPRRDQRGLPSVLTTT